MRTDGGRRDPPSTDDQAISHPAATALSRDDRPSGCDHPSGPAGAPPRLRDRISAWRSAVPAEGPGIFSPRARRAGIVWVLATVPAASVAGMFIGGTRSYLVGWVLVSGLYTGPGVVVTWLVLKRVEPAARRFWQLWALGLLFCYGVGLSILFLALSGAEVFKSGAVLSFALATGAFTVALVSLMRDRSGARQVWIDFCQSAMVVLGIVALAIPPLAPSLLGSSEGWFVLPTTITATCLLAAFSWSLRLIGRLGDGPRTVEEFGAAVAFTGSLSATAQAAQGLSGFTLPAAPLYALQAVCMGLLLLTPLHQPKRGAVGLDRLPPQEQVRGAGIDALVAVLLLGLLFAECVAVAGTERWAYTVFAAVALTQLALASAQYLLAIGENRRLYARVSQAAAERKALLEGMVRGLDRDRHRVAAQLHEQAISSYVALSAATRAGKADADPASSLRRSEVDRLAAQADELRRLMLAVKPLEVTDGGADRLAAPVAAYLHSLYGDEPAPKLTINVEDGLDPPWMLETVIFRILQEALRNVRAHAGTATRISIGIRLTGDDRIEVLVEDDGEGFDPSGVIESGIEMMRMFASLADGWVEISSSPGHGSSVRAVVGGTATPDDPGGPRPPALPAGTDRPRLRLVSGEPDEGDSAR